MTTKTLTNVISLNLRYTANQILAFVSNGDDKLIEWYSDHPINQLRVYTINNLGHRTLTKTLTNTLLSNPSYAEGDYVWGFSINGDTYDYTRYSIAGSTLARATGNDFNIERPTINGVKVNFSNKVRQYGDYLLLIGGHPTLGGRIFAFERKTGGWHIVGRISGGVGGTNGTIAETPKRVTILPNTGKDQETIYLENTYTNTQGVEITPENFSETPVDGYNTGTRGWYGKDEYGGELGYISPSLPSDFLLISDTRVYVKRGTQTNLSKIIVAGTEYTLTRVPQSAGWKIIQGPAGVNTPDAEYYTITGGLPAGDWDQLRFKTSANAFIPATITIPKGFYQYNNSDWQLSEFDAPEAQRSRDLKFMVEELIAGAPQSKASLFQASGSNFTMANPFPNVLDITYNNTSSVTALYQRYTVKVPTANFEDSKTPVKLTIGSASYALSYYETGGSAETAYGEYRTLKIPVAGDRALSNSFAKMVNIQYRDGSWAGVSATVKNNRTITSGDLADLSKQLTTVHTFPQNPVYGQRVQLLSSVTAQGGAVMTTAEDSAGRFIGYGATITGSSLNPTSNTISTLGSYTNDTSNAADLRNKTAMSIGSKIVNLCLLYTSPSPRD